MTPKLTVRMSNIGGDAEMSHDDDIQSDDEIQSYVPNGKPDHFDMDEAFCARMRGAIAAGLESAPHGIVTTPGTRNPRYVPTK